MSNTREITGSITIVPKRPLITPLFYFATLLFVYSLGDGIMSYVAPVIMEKHLHSTFLMGLVFSASSAAGFLADLLFGKYFGNRSYKFFVLWGSALAVLFPLSFTFLPPLVVVFLTGMIIWGLYFELLEFGLFAYVESFHHPQEHAKVWGLVSAFKGASYMVGPALATYSLGRGENVALITAGCLFGFGLLGYLLFWWKFGHGHRHIFRDNPENLPLITHFTAVWTVLRKIWPVWVFTLLLYMVDATFWTVGTLFSEQLGKQHPFGNMLMSVYMVPSVLAGMMTAWFAKPFGKKRAAYVGGLLQGLSMVMLGFVINVPMILLVVFLSSFFAAISFPEILATAEDYVTRLKGMGSIMVSLQLTSASLGFVIGPTLAGYIAEKTSIAMTFVVVGLLLAMGSVVMMIVTPRKIHLPQQELETVIGSA
ncbi:hypothetical protein A3B57_00105 [Microgenomates group bacterium RIFCSPLOWO2_01_FULL_47_10]|nr:MAG: hypothetical protein A3B57_00105 [Microgenomates group bacterium RIFCSPLOWO2_01_FULL_47_10]